MKNHLFLIALVVVGISYTPDYADDPVPARSAKSVITDPNGQPLPEEIALGEMVVFSGKKAIHGTSLKSLMWIVEPPVRAVRSTISDDGLTVYVPTGMKDVTLRITQVAAMNDIMILPANGDVPMIMLLSAGDIPSITTVNVRCGNGGQPPPGPGPTPPPVPGKVSKVNLILVDDYLNRLPSTAKIIANETWLMSLRTKGVGWRTIDKGSLEPSSVKYLSQMQDNSGNVVVPPALMIRDATTDTKLNVVKLPTTTGDIDAAYSSYLIAP